MSTHMTLFGKWMDNISSATGMRVPCHDKGDKYTTCMEGADPYFGLSYVYNITANSVDR